MKEIIYNYDNLKEEEISKTVNRVKVLLTNSKNEILLGYCDDIYQFIGGHMEKGESFIDCIIREVKEETGISLSLDAIEPFMAIKYYNKDYPKAGVNRLSAVYYFAIKSDDSINYDQINYTEQEKQGNFELRYINLDNVTSELENNLNNNEKSKIIVRDMISAILEYQKNNKS